MNKKVLVITLALIVAFAGSAMAAVNLTGEFRATIEQDSFKVLKDEYRLSPNAELKVNLKSGEEDGDSWSLTAAVTNLTDLKKISLGKYKLELKDQYFNAWVWGNAQELTDKATQFSMIKAAKKAATHRARLEVPVLDLATVTLDFDPNDTLRAFVDGSVEGIDVGLAFARKDWTTDSKNIIVGYGKGTFDAGDYAINTKAEAGVILGDELGFALGLGADTKVTDDVKVEATVTHANSNWVGADALKADNTVLFGKGTFSNDELEAFASVKETLVKDDDNVNEIEVGAKYRLSTVVSYNNLFHNDHWFKNTAPAAGVSAKFVDLKFDNVKANVASPIVEDMVWVRAYASYNKDKEIGAGADARILATNKLTLTPAVDYKSTGQEIDAKFRAAYKIGTSDVELSFLAQKVFTEDGHTDKDGKLVAKELLQASVKVPF